MSYDIDLKDPVTKETIELPVKHLMIGGTYRADYDPETKQFTPTPISEAHLNITYNYGHYYYEAAMNDERFYHAIPEIGHDEIDNQGIRGIYGKTGAESIPMLKDMIERITRKYSKDGEWITTEREITRYYDSKGNELDHADVIHMLLHDNDNYTKVEGTEMVNEGVNSDYWKPTAGNAIRPLFQLITMAQLRPDGVWEGD